MNWLQHYQTTDKLFDQYLTHLSSNSETVPKFVALTNCLSNPNGPSENAELFANFNVHFAQWKTTINPPAVEIIPPVPAQEEMKNADAMSAASIPVDPNPDIVIPKPKNNLTLDEQQHIEKHYSKLVKANQLLVRDTSIMKNLQQYKTNKEFPKAMLISYEIPAPNDCITEEMKTKLKEAELQMQQLRLDICIQARNNSITLQSNKYQEIFAKSMEELRNIFSIIQRNLPTDGLNQDQFNSRMADRVNAKLLAAQLKIDKHVRGAQSKFEIGKHFEQMKKNSFHEKRKEEERIQAELEAKLENADQKDIMEALIGKTLNDMGIKRDTRKSTNTRSRSRSRSRSKSQSRQHSKYRSQSKDKAIYNSHSNSNSKNTRKNSQSRSRSKSHSRSRSRSTSRVRFNSSSYKGENKSKSKSQSTRSNIQSNTKSKTRSPSVSRSRSRSHSRSKSNSHTSSHNHKYKPPQRGRPSQSWRKNNY